MLREKIYSGSWRERTLTVLREKQFDACERRFLKYPQYALFDEGLTDQNAQQLYANSFEAEKDRLITISCLRQQVLDRFRAEAVLISPDEEQLLYKLALDNGRHILDDRNELEPAEALVKRLWCGWEKCGDELCVTLPDPILDLYFSAVKAPAYKNVRQQLQRFQSVLDGMLYLTGFMHQAQPLSIFLNELIQDQSSQALTLARRFLRTSYEYQENKDGSLVLFHPGMAGTRSVSYSFENINLFYESLQPQIIFGSMNGILPQEIQPHEAMCGALIGAIRPDCDVFETAQDLRILIKQGITFAELQDVLQSLLQVQMTKYITQALHNLYLQTPRWPAFQSDRLN